MDGAARRIIASLERGEDPPPARLAVSETVDGTFLRLDVLWDPDVAGAFDALPGAVGPGHSLPIDPWIVEALDAFLALHDVAIDGSATETLEELRAEHDEALSEIRASRATSAEPIAETAAVLGGELAPFQWAGVRYALRARRAFLADEQGLGKTVEALAALEADDAYPAVVVCPASLKLNWERETAKWLPHRSVAVIQGRMPVPPTAEITILNYEVVAAHRETLGRMRPRALVVDESHLCKNPQAKRTQAVRRLAETVVPDGLRLALTGTPVLNHAEELISQLRVIGRLEDFGSGARFSRQFRGQLSEERLHWHLRRRCFVRRLKSEVLPQLPAKRQVVVPVALDNEREYRLAENDVIAWLREQPLDLRELNARIAATLRAERLAQLGTLQRLAARGKLHAALAWIHDFLASGEPLVVFARHIEVQEAVMERFPRRPAPAGPRQDPRPRRVRPRLPGPRRPAAHRVRDARRRPGDHAHARVERRLPRARVDAGHARPGRGPPAPHRPARRGHGVVPAGGRHDRRDHGPPHPPQARPHRRGDRRAHVRERRDGRRRGARAARRQALPPPAQRGVGRDTKRRYRRRQITGCDGGRPTFDARRALRSPSGGPGASR